MHADGGRGSGPERPASIELELGFRMGQTHKALKETWERHIADLGLSAPLAAMLRAICEQPGSGLRELARKMRTDPMNAKRLVDHLEHEGLVASSAGTSHAQRRAVSPTADGLARVTGLIERSTELRRQLARLLGEGDVEQLQLLLVRLEDALFDEPKRAPNAKPGATRPGHQEEEQRA